MSTTAVSSSSLFPTSATAATSSSSNSTLDFSDFLTLLTSELKYQDPDDPVSSTEYVSQMAQLSSLTQMENVNSTVNNIGAFSLIGKEVAYQTTDSSGTTSTYTGSVESVISSSGITYLNIDGTEVPLSDVVEVASDTDSAGSST